MQIIGNSEARAFLERAVATKQIAPSYLFVGPRGVGKALTARWFAQRIFCDSKTERPCGECSACRRMISGNYPDFKFSERLVRNGPNEGIVDQVRAIIADLQTSPYEADLRLFSFNDAGALNEQSQNCLLKTVEEPPPHLVLVLVAESLGKVLPTILSRCCIVRFSAVEREELVEALIERGCDPERAPVLAAISGGAPGQALQLMKNERVWEFRREVLNIIQELNGGNMWGALETARLLEDMVPRKEAKADASEAFAPDFRGLLDICTSYYRDAMLLAAGAPAESVVNCDCLLPLYELAEHRGAGNLEKDLERLVEAGVHLSSNVQARLWLQQLCLSLSA